MSSKPLDPRLLARLEAVKDLKGQYYVGSWNALRYLRAMDYYTALSQEIRRDDAIARKPTIHTIARMMPAACNIVEQSLNLMSLEASTPESLSLITKHELNKLAPIGACKSIPAWLRTERHEAMEDVRTYRWTLDVAMWVKSHLASAAQGPAARDDTVPRKRQVFGAFAWEMFAVQDLPCLIFEPTGERVTPRQFQAEPKFRQGDIRQFWIKVKMTLECASLKIGKRKPSELKRLQQSWRARDLKTCHAILRQAMLRDERGETARMLRDRADDLLSEGE